MQPSISVRRLVSYGAFPVIFGGAMSAALWLASRGTFHGPQLLALLGPTYVAVMLLERLFPYHERWQRSHGDLAVDGLLAGTSVTAIGALTPVFQATGFVVAARLSFAFGGTLWPAQWPLWAQLVLAAVIGEFFAYWQHRLAHENPWLWRFHAVHHSAPRLYWLNNIRFHPVDLLLESAVKAIPLAALGAGEEIFLLTALLTGAHGVFQHANVELRLGPLNWVFSMAELHRWHHSRSRREANTNYGSDLILWDVVFGTRFLPDRAPPTDIGLAGMPQFPSTYWAQIMAPVRWKRLGA